MTGKSGFVMGEQKREARRGRRTQPPERVSLAVPPRSRFLWPAALREPAGAGRPTGLRTPARSRGETPLNSGLTGRIPLRSAGGTQAHRIVAVGRAIVVTV